MVLLAVLIIQNLNHSNVIIELNNYSFESSSDVSHSLTSRRVIGIVSDKRSDTSTLHTYREQMILDPMFPATEWKSYKNKFSFFGQRFGVPFQSNNEP